MAVISQKKERISIILTFVIFLIFVGSTFLFFTKAFSWKDDSLIGAIYIQGEVAAPNILQLMFGYGSVTLLSTETWPRIVGLTFVFAVQMLLIISSVIILILYLTKRMKINLVAFSMAFLSILALFAGVLPLFIIVFGDNVKEFTISTGIFKDIHLSDYAKLAAGPIIYSLVTLFTVFLGFFNLIFVSINKKK